MKSKANKENYLDKIPCHNEKYQYEIDAEGRVIILVENKGPFNFVAQKLLGKPRVSKIHLEEFGTFVWLHIDGNRSIKEIADLLKKEFGEKAEPLYPRISMYMKSLYDNSFITF